MQNQDTLSWKEERELDAGAVVGKAGPLPTAIGQEEDGDKGTPPLRI